MARCGLLVVGGSASRATPPLLRPPFYAATRLELFNFSGNVGLTLRVGKSLGFVFDAQSVNLLVGLNAGSSRIAA
jgi:hypothetical protein